MPRGTILHSYLSNHILLRDLTHKSALIIGCHMSTMPLRYDKPPINTIQIGTPKKTSLKSQT